MKRAILAVLVMLVWAMPARAATIALDWYSESGFATGDLIGEPIHFIVSLNGDSGNANGFSNQSTFKDMETTASLTVGNAEIFSIILIGDVFLAHDEGIDSVESTIFGVHTLFASPGNSGPVKNVFLPATSAPSAIDQYLLLGNFLPLAFAPYYVNSYIDYDGNRADLSSLSISAVSDVPIPAAFPLFAGALGFLGWAAKRTKPSV